MDLLKRPIKVPLRIWQMGINSWKSQKSSSLVLGILEHLSCIVGFFAKCFGLKRLFPGDDYLGRSGFSGLGQVTSLGFNMFHKCFMASWPSIKASKIRIGC